jgi:hypothetical protein
MGDKSPMSRTREGSHPPEKRDEPARQTIDALSIPVPTLDEWDATLARIGNRLNGRKDNG